MKKLSTKNNYLSGDIMACVEPPHIPLIKQYPEKIKKESNYVNIKLHRNPVTELYEIYETKLVLFENGEPEDLLILIFNLKKTLKYKGENLQVCGYSNCINFQTERCYTSLTALIILPEQPPMEIRKK